MTNHRFHHTLYVLCFALVIMLSCKKSITDDAVAVLPGQTFAVPVSTPVSGSVSGRIVDENNIAVASAAVVCAGVTTATDDNGFFNITNATLDKYITTVIVTKPGYFKGYRSFCANASRNYVNIKLIPKTLSGTFTSTSAGNVTLSNATNLSFQPNSMVIKSSGAAYNGTVNVYASYIDPTSTDISATVPGSFVGRHGNNLYALESTGMIAVDLESPSGEALQLATNMIAGIKLPIPTSLQTKAPATIDTWSLDEQGIWKKEGTASRVGNNYEMQVTHFSFWNCDIAYNAVYLNLHVQDGNTMPVTNTPVSLTSTSNSGFGTRCGFTDSYGNVSGFVPSNEQLGFNILASTGICAGIFTVLYSQNVGPFSTNSSLTVTAIISIPPGSADTLNVSGTANDCSGQPLASGVALIYSGQEYKYVSIINGSYSTTFVYCTPITSIMVHFIDNSGSNLVSVGPIAVSGSSVSIPLVSICLNMYDGIYQMTGSFSDVTNAALTGVFPQQFSLITTGLNTVYVRNDDLNGGLPGYIFQNAGSGTYYGSFGLNVSFDLVTNAVIEVHNYYGDPANPPAGGQNPATGSGAPLYAAANTRRAVLDPSGINNYDPVTKTIKIKYFMYQSTVVPVGPRAFFEETWTYIGPR